MQQPYQDKHPEVPCSECGGAGFSGNGPLAEACGVCGGTGVLINESVTILPVAPKKPITRDRRKLRRKSGSR